MCTHLNRLIDTHKLLTTDRGGEAGRRGRRVNAGFKLVLQDPNPHSPGSVVVQSLLGPHANILTKYASPLLQPTSFTIPILNTLQSTSD